MIGMLERSGATGELIEEVCRILESHDYARKGNPLNSNIVHDAYQLARLKSGSGGKGKAEVKDTLHERFLTATGKKMAEAFDL